MEHTHLALLLLIFGWIKLDLSALKNDLNGIRQEFESCAYHHDGKRG